MTDPTPKPRRKGVSLGETIAILALLISAAGLYNSWQSKQTGPTEVLESKPAVPLVLRGTVEDRGKTLAELINRKADGNVRATVEARYVEAGTERKASRRYAIRYRWEGGGLFDDRKLRFVGFSRG